jgi:carbamate kinase
MTQGQLGGVLVRAIDRIHGRGRAVAVVTHVGVDPDDPAFAARVARSIQIGCPDGANAE